LLVFPPKKKENKKKRKRLKRRRKKRRGEKKKKREKKREKGAAIWQPLAAHGRRAGQLGPTRRTLMCTWDSHMWGRP